MILVALALLGFGACDLVRWTPKSVGLWRALGAAAAGAALVAAVAALGGMDSTSVLLAGGVSVLVLSLWSAYDHLPKWARPEYALLLAVGAVVVLVGLSGSADPVDGPIGHWYENLGLDFARHIAVDQFVLAVGAGVYLLATANRIVCFTLDASAPSLSKKGEEAMRGGRVLGPMERLIVAAAVVSGSIAGAGFVIAAKGLLRFREIPSHDRPPGEKDAGDGADAEASTLPTVDEVTEYFLVGTLTSVLIAAAVGLLVLAGA